VVGLLDNEAIIEARSGRTRLIAALNGLDPRDSVSDFGSKVIAMSLVTMDSDGPPRDLCQVAVTGHRGHVTFDL